MKVLHINCNYMTTKLHQTMIEHLDKLTENTVFCPMIREGKSVVNPNDNVTAVECFSNIDRIFFYRKQSLIIKTLEERLNLHNYDIIHAYTLFTDGNCAMKLSQKFGVPYVVAIRDTDMNDFFKLKPYLIGRGIMIMENAARVFFLSDTYKQRMLDNYVPPDKRSVLEAKMLVIPNGIDDFWLDNIFYQRDLQKTLQKIRNKQLNVVCVGQIIKKKNIPFIQKALNILWKNGWKIQLDVVGKKVDEMEYKRIVASPYTTYHDSVPKDKLINFYRENDLFILASHTETFGLVYAEAMSQGLPVLYTKGQGFDSQFPEGKVGFHVDNRNSYDIYINIKKICEDYILFSNNSLNLAKRFDWDNICKRYREIYEGIIYGTGN